MPWTDIDSLDFVDTQYFHNHPDDTRLYIAVSWWLKTNSHSFINGLDQCQNVMEVFLDQKLKTLILQDITRTSE